MTQKELEQAVWKLIDDECMEMSQYDYRDLLYSIRDDADIRAQTVDQEILNKEGEEDEDE